MMSKEIKHDRCGRRRGCGESADGNAGRGKRERVQKVKPDERKVMYE